MSDATPSWVRTASPHAMVTRDELLEWIKVNGVELHALVNKQGFPKPRMGVSPQGRYGIRTRWRVGDVRAWVAGNADRQEREMAKPPGDPTSTMGKARREAGAGPMMWRQH